MNGECAYCRIGDIVEYKIYIPNPTTQDSGYRYSCNNEECGIRYRIDPTNGGIIFLQ